MRRDPRRIPEILQLLGVVWTQYPRQDLRICQLLNHAAKVGGWKGGEDLFMCEDSIIIAGLSQLAQGDVDK
jgi:uncharacterized protein YihD (DUF1040 family)